MGKNTVYSVAIAIVALMFGGCATQQTHLPMTKDAQSRIQSTDVVIGLAQEEIFAEIEESNVSVGTGGGLLGALIDASINSSRTNDAETLISPIKNSLIEYDFPSEFEAALNVELQRLAWLNAIKYEIKKPYSPNKDNDILRNASADAVIVLNTSYRFSPGLKSIIVSSAVKGFPRSEELKRVAEKSNPDSEKPLLYTNSFVYSQPLQATYTDGAQASKAWAKNGAEQVRAALTQGVAELAEMIATDLEIARAQYNDESLQVGKGEQVTYDGKTGTLVSKGENRVVLRLDDGSMYSAPNGN